MDHRARDVTAGVVGGLLGGLAGAGMMSLAHAMLAARWPSAPANAAPAEDATVKVADGLARAVRGRPLARAEKPRAGTAVHYAFGALLGLAYGTAASVAPTLARGRGLGFGAAAWVGPHAVVVPALGLAPSPLRQPAGQEALELGLHLLYGATTEVIRRVTVALAA